MNNKLYHNILLDITALFSDIIIVFSTLFVSMRLAGQTDYITIGVYLITIVAMLAIYEFYTKTIRRKYDIALSVVISVIFAGAITYFAGMLFQKYILKFSILFFLYISAANIVLLTAGKILHNLLCKHFDGSPKLLVIETNEVENDLARKVKYSYATVYDSWYLMIDVNSREEIEEIVNVKFKEYDNVFISPSISPELRNYFISKALGMGKEIFVLPDISSVSVLKSEVVQFDDTPALRIRSFNLTNGQKIIKRAFDILCSAVMIIVTSPVMLICAAAIKLDTKGSVIYKQERLTKYMQPFNIYKFRTMISDAEKITGEVMAKDNDPRITRVGRVLRSLRLDELPQLFNILFGSMSIVGPRPERPVFVKQYLEEIDNYDKRFFVKAGLTGLAQVYGRYHTNVSDKTLYDILYIRDFSFAVDIKIILLTIKVMFLKESSEGVKEPVNYAVINKNTSSADKAGIER